MLIKDKKTSPHHRTRVFSRAAILVVAAMAAGCAPPMWVRPKTDSRLDSAFAAQVPPNWIIHRPKSKHTVVLTKDGVDLDAIALRLTPNDKAFPHLKKPARPNMLVSDLAADEIAEIKRSSAIQNIAVKDNRPARISGHDGFRIMLAQVDSKGLEHRRLIYGFDTQDGFYTLMFSAPAIHYFNRYRADFEAVVSSFSLSRSFVAGR